MREFPARAEDYDSIDRAISALVYDATRANKVTFAIFKGIRLEVNPKKVSSHSLYASELTWIFHAVRTCPELLGKRPVYTNIMPELRSLAGRQMQALPNLDITDMRAAIRWLVEIAPATRYKPLWTAKRSELAAKKLRKVLTNRRTQPVHPAVALLSSRVFKKGAWLITIAARDFSRHECLSLEWIGHAKEWLVKVS